MTTPLADRDCSPRHDIAPLGSAEVASLREELGADWATEEDHHLHKRYAFPDFVTALAFVNKVGEVAEAVQHHPDIVLTWGKVEITIFTHDIGGLQEADFILAAKLDRLPR